jgi:hypothetical protein
LASPSAGTEETISIQHLNAEHPDRCLKSKCKLAKYLRAINSKNKPFQTPKLPDWSDIIFIGYSWFRDPRFKGSEDPPYLEIMKGYKPDIDTPTMEASYQKRAWSWLGDKIFPDYIEKEGGDVTADASSYSIDVGDRPAEDQQKTTVWLLTLLGSWTLERRLIPFQLVMRNKGICNAFLC